MEHPVDTERQRAEEDANERAHLQNQTKRRSAGPAPGAVAIMPGVAKPMTPKEPPQPIEEVPEAPHPAPVSVLPPIGHGVSHTPSVPQNTFNPATLACELRRPPSSDEEDNDADWEDEDAAKPKSHAPTSVVEPAPPTFSAQHDSPPDNVSDCYFSFMITV
ncbi:hypothetical protein COOONC_17360 [Cooperia oncophora]